MSARIEELIGAPVALLSTSPERDDTILVHNPFRGLTERERFKVDGRPAEMVRTPHG